MKTETIRNILKERLAKVNTQIYDYEQKFKLTARQCNACGNYLDDMDAIRRELISEKVTYEELLFNIFGDEFE